MSQPSLLLVFRRHVESFAHLPWIFAKEGFRVEAACTRFTRQIRFSRHIQAHHQLPYEAEDFCRVLDELVSQRPPDFLLLVDEPALTAVFAGQPGPALSRLLPFSAASEIATTVGRKDLFQAFAERHGIPTPKTAVVDNPMMALNVAREYGLPVVIKGGAGSSGNTVHINRTQDQLTSCLQAMPADEPVLVQQYIEGMTAAATFLADRGRLKCWIATTKRVALSKGKGPTVAGELLHDPRIGEVCRLVAAAGCIHGITGFDFMQDASGAIHAIDPHFGRLTTLTHFGPMSGVDFGRALSECLQGDVELISPSPSRYRFVKYPEFLIHLYEGGLLQLIREAPPWRRDVRYFFAQPGEWRLATVLGLLTCWSLFRCFLGAIKARVRPSR